MRRTILVIALLITAVSSTFAQFTIGPKIGLNMTKEYAGIEGIDEDVDFKLGLNIGLFGRYGINDRFNMQAEVLYSQQGYKSDIILADINGALQGIGYKASSHYLNIPLSLRFYLLKRFYIEAGPQIGFCIDSNFSSDNADVENAMKELNTDYNTLDFSLAGGIGYDIGYGLSINARYVHGFTKTLTESPWKNRVIQLSIAYDLWSF